jgi:uncharacterized metal-binding protein
MTTGFDLSDEERREFAQRIAILEARIRASQRYLEEESYYFPYPEFCMKIQYKTSNGRMVFDLEASKGTQAIEILASIQEVFEEPCCGCCKSEKIRLQVRKMEKGNYYEWLCNACTATIQIHQRKEGGGLYIVRKDKDNDYAPLPDRGWSIYKPKGESSSSRSRDRDDEPRQEETTGDIPF